VQLVRPTHQHLAAYTAALKRGWSADNVRGAAAAAEELARIEADPAAFLRGFDDPEALAGPVTLADGSQVPRIPGLRRLMWAGPGEAASDDEAFIGSIGLRWMKGGAPLPPHVLGHIGYTVVPWHQRRGFATQALGLILPLARAQGLAAVEITTDPDNEPSQRVITANGGVLVEQFDKGPVYGHRPGLRFRIVL
jgi:predicted acetyltransferase